MDVSLETIGFLVMITIGFSVLYLYMYIDGLKFKARNAQIDADFYRKMYDLELQRRYEITTEDYKV